MIRRQYTHKQWTNKPLLQGDILYLLLSKSSLQICSLLSCEEIPALVSCVPVSPDDLCDGGAGEETLMIISQLQERIQEQLPESQHHYTQDIVLAAVNFSFVFTNSDNIINSAGHTAPLRPVITTSLCMSRLQAWVRLTVKLWSLSHFCFRQSQFQFMTPFS